MALSASDRARFVRQLLLPQLGERGQERLLAAKLWAAEGADPGTLQVARAYLERAGVRVCERVDAGDGAREPVEEASELALYAPAEIARIAGDQGLAEAARALAGALVAVAAIRKIVDLPGPAEQLPVVPLSPLVEARAGGREQSTEARDLAREQR